MRVIDFENARQSLAFVRCRRAVAAQFNRMIVDIEGVRVVASGIRWHATWLHASGEDATRPLALAAAIDWFFSTKPN